MATLTLSTTTFYSRQTITDVTAVTFANLRGTTAQAVFSGVQIDVAKLHANALITGSAGINQLVVQGKFINAHDFNFASWGGSDLVWLKGTAANDLIHASRVSDLIETGDGNDQISDTNGILGSADTIRAGAGDDIIYLATAGIVDGGAGRDLYWADYTPTGTAISLDIRDGGGGRLMANGIQLIDIDKLDLSCGDGNDTVWGGGLSDKIIGRGGDDVLNGGDGEDGIYGGTGNNILNGGARNDGIVLDLNGDSVVDGGDGIDSLDMDLGGFALNIVIDLRDGGGGRTLVTGDSLINMERLGRVGFSTFQIGAGDDQVWGGGYADAITDLGGNDMLDAGGGADQIFAGAGRDTLLGGDGDDYLGAIMSAPAGTLALNLDNLDGGAGNDTLESGASRQNMTGGSGEDTFLFAGSAAMGLGKSADRILDFEHGVDTISFVTDGGFPGADHLVHFIGSAAFSSPFVTQARVTSSATETVLQLGNSLAGVQWEIHFGHRVTIDAGDILT